MNYWSTLLPIWGVNNQTYPGTIKDDASLSHGKSVRYLKEALSYHSRAERTHDNADTYSTPLHDRGTTVTGSQIQQSAESNAGTGKTDHLMSLEHAASTDFAATPLIRALAAYQLVPLRSLLSEIERDYQTETSRTASARFFTECMEADHQTVAKGVVERIMQLGTGASDRKVIYPRYQLLTQVITELSAEFGDCPTGSVLTALFDHARRYPGGLSHQLVSSLMSAGGHYDDIETGEKTGRGYAFTGINSTSGVVAALGVALSSFTSASADSYSGECRPTDFTCKNDKCVDHLAVCDSHDDCGDLSDEHPEQCSKYCKDSGRFKCSTISECVPYRYVCDGDYDCRDGSDEGPANCPCSRLASCPPGSVKCLDGSRCISRLKLCDGKQDCTDGSDESDWHCTQKPCTPGQERCEGSKACLPEAEFCDGSEDCMDGSDESSDRCCPAKCKDSGVCIPVQKLCDNVKDCNDGSDENIRQCEQKIEYKTGQWLAESSIHRPRLEKICCEKGHEQELKSQQALFLDLLKTHFSIKDCSFVRLSGGRFYECSPYCSSWDIWAKTTKDLTGLKDKIFYCTPEKLTSAELGKYIVRQGCVTGHGQKYSGNKKAAFCDGQQFCRNGRDELADFCYIKCAPGKIPCGQTGSPQCIDPNQLCDGIQNCRNGRDEDPYTCLSELIHHNLKASCSSFTNTTLNSQCKKSLQKTCCDAISSSTGLPGTSIGHTPVTTGNSTRIDSKESGRSSPKAAALAHWPIYAGTAIAVLGLGAIGIAGAFYCRARRRHLFPGELRVDNQPIQLTQIPAEEHLYESIASVKLDKKSDDFKSETAFCDRYGESSKTRA